MTTTPTFQVGDVVTWGNPNNPRQIKVKGCIVLELGVSTDGKPAARIEALGQSVNALCEDLTLEVRKP